MNPINVGFLGGGNEMFMGPPWRVHGVPSKPMGGGSEPERFLLLVGNYFIRFLELEHLYLCCRPFPASPAVVLSSSLESLVHSSSSSACMLA